VPATVSFAGFAGNRLYQLNVIVPEVAGGDRAPAAAPLVRFSSLVVPDPEGPTAMPPVAPTQACCRTALDPSNFREIDQTKPTISFVFNTDR
jgi:hypothetical protein